jgi:hypothetical protein
MGVLGRDDDRDGSGGEGVVRGRGEKGRWATGDTSQNPEPASMPSSSDRERYGI